MVRVSLRNALWLRKSFKNTDGNSHYIKYPLPVLQVDLYFGCVLVPVWGGDLLRKQTLVRCIRGLFIRAWISPFIFIPSLPLLASLAATPKSFFFRPVSSFLGMCEFKFYHL